VKKFRVLGALPVLLICTVVSAVNLPFINDDYPKALAAAKRGNLPIFVEVWAPW